MVQPRRLKACTSDHHQGWGRSSQSPTHEESGGRNVIHTVQRGDFFPECFVLPRVTAGTDLVARCLCRWEASRGPLRFRRTLPGRESPYVGGSGQGTHPRRFSEAGNHQRGGTFVGDHYLPAAVRQRTRALVSAATVISSSVGLVLTNALLATELSTSISWPQTGFGETTGDVPESDFLPE